MIPNFYVIFKRNENFKRAQCKIHVNVRKNDENKTAYVMCMFRKRPKINSPIEVLLNKPKNRVNIFSSLQWKIKHAHEIQQQQMFDIAQQRAHSIDLIWRSPYIFTFLGARLSPTELIAFIQVCRRFCSLKHQRLKYNALSWCLAFFFPFVTHLNDRFFLVRRMSLRVSSRRIKKHNSMYQAITIKHTWGPHATNYNIWFSLWPIWHATFFSLSSLTAFSFHCYCFSIFYEE